MTRKETLLLLLDIQAEAGKWTVEYPDNGYELEVKQRIENIINELQDPDDAKPRNSEAKKASNDKYRETHVKIREGGKELWAYKDDCEYVLNEKTGKMHWRRKQKHHQLQDADFDVENA